MPGLLPARPPVAVAAHARAGRIIAQLKGSCEALFCPDAWDAYHAFLTLAEIMGNATPLPRALHSLFALHLVLQHETAPHTPLFARATLLPVVSNVAAHTFREPLNSRFWTELTTPTSLERCFSDSTAGLPASVDSLTSLKQFLCAWPRLDQIHIYDASGAPVDTFAELPDTFVWFVASHVNEKFPRVTLRFVNLFASPMDLVTYEVWAGMPMYRFLSDAMVTMQEFGVSVRDWTKSSWSVYVDSRQVSKALPLCASLRRPGGVIEVRKCSQVH